MNAREISIVFNKLNLSEEFSGSLTPLGLTFLLDSHTHTVSLSKEISINSFMLRHRNLLLFFLNDDFTVRRCESISSFFAVVLMELNVCT